MRTLLAVFLLLPLHISAQPSWQQHVHYTIDATLNTNTHRINGKERLVYTNNSPDTLDVVYFHLYWNLFTQGSYGQQLGERHKDFYHDTTGGITINRFAEVDDGVERTPEYSIDNTLMEVRLTKSILPGASATFLFEYEERVPEGGARTGHQGRDYNIAQWYPQIATYDKYGWDKSQYLGAEFYLEYGTFDVSVTIPKNFTLGHTGVLLNPEEVYPDSIRLRLKESVGNTETVRIADYSTKEWKDDDTALVTWRFHADSVRDFAWSANEHYIWDVTYWSPGVGANPIAIHALYFQDKAEFWKEAARIGQHAISFYSTHFGLYAYPSMFVVEGVVGGGMEYPGIVFNSHLGDENNHSLFGVLSHEIGHSWYPMMIGSNETAFPFMDEGFTTFITARAYEDYYGRYDNTFVWTRWYQKLLRFPNDHEREELQRSSLDLAKTGYEEPAATHSYRVQEPGLYGTSIYPKTASILYMLQYVLGDSVFESVMKEYYRRWKFKHPYPEDFYTVAQDVSSRDLRWFFDEWFHRTWTCDYGICGFDYDEAKSGNQTVYRTELSVRRYQPAIMPVDVRIEMEDETSTTVWFPIDLWMNAEVERDTVIELSSKPVGAELNPDGRILDINRLNNRRPLPNIVARLDNTLFNVTPVDAYVIRYRPSLWYTDKGGWNFGYSVSGSYLDDLYAMSLWQAYNARDNTLNYDLTLSHNIYRLMSLSRASFRWYRVEGRKGVVLSLDKGIRRHHSYPPFHNLNLRYSYSQADDNEYLLHPATWEEGALHRVLVGYNYHNRGSFWNVNASATLESSTSLFGRSDFQYSKRTFEIATTFDMPAGWDLSLRFYNGIGYGGVPNQTRYYFSNSSPLEQINEPLLRSKGVLPSTVRDHALSPGGGFMRGYYAIIVAGDKIDALNAEARFQTLIPFIDFNVPVLNYLTQYVHTSFFFDAGRIALQSQKLWDQRFEVDFGFGFRLASLYRILGTFSQSSLLSSIGLRTLRVDFPIYLSMPPGEENKLKLRWVVSFRVNDP